MARCRRHTFQVLTKRPSRLHEPFLKEMEWPANVWTGVSIESERHLSHAAILRMTGARVKFLSLEPLLGPPPGLDLDVHRGLGESRAMGIRLYGCRGLGAGHSRQVPARGGRVLLQAVGRDEQEAHGPRSRRQDMGPDAGTARLDSRRGSPCPGRGALSRRRQQRRLWPPPKPMVDYWFPGWAVREACRESVTVAQVVRSASTRLGGFCAVRISGNRRFQAVAGGSVRDRRRQAGANDGGDPLPRRGGADRP